MEKKNNFPDIYVLSKFSNLSTELKNFLPQDVNINTIHIPGINLNTQEMIQVPDEIIRVLEDAEVFITDTTCLAYLLYKLPNIKWVQSTRAGIELVYTELDLSQPLPQFTTTRYVDTYTSDLMSNYVLAQIINVERKLFYYHDKQKEVKWVKRSYSSRIRVLNDLTIGILGAGTIGSAVGQLLKKCGCKVIVFVRKERNGSSESYDKAVTDLNTILEESDYICNSLPSTKKTRGLLDNDVFQNCKKKPVFINIGRGDVIQTESLVKALREGWISGAILDVFSEEPLLPDNPLWNIPEVHITPHIGAIPKDEQIAKFAAANYLRYVNGKPLMNVVDWENGY